MKKRLVIFCDGTWNRPEQFKAGDPCPTNVVKLAMRLDRDCAGVQQLVYYGRGVGTGGSIDKFTGGAFGEGLQDNLHAAYQFIVLNYAPGDDIFLFGFSRGAYTARSLAGMIRKCGILQLKHARNYKRALDLYCDAQHPNAEDPSGFRKSYSACGGQGTRIRFLGVWDTVGALGIPVRGLRSLTAHKYKFHDVELSGAIEIACQALAIDERRAPFEAARWAYVPKPGQLVSQAWFAGAHSDIGGGYPPTESGLSDIALMWMQEQAESAGLCISRTVAEAYPLKPDPMSLIHDSKIGLYRLTAGIDRAIGVAAGRTEQPGMASTEVDRTQFVHPSVLQRWDADPGYRPANLRNYFRLMGDARGTAAR